MSADPDIKPYFQVRRPAHFWAHPSLIEELCLPEQIQGTLPKTQKEYDIWLRASGYTSSQLPFKKVQSRASERYQMTDRYVLKSPILPGRRHHTNVIVDGNLWSLVTEYGGLFEHVFDRAVELAMLHGLSQEKANRLLRLSARQEICDDLRHAAWAIGYEPDSGLCTILATDHGETERLFLQGEPGYYTPFAKGL